MQFSLAGALIACAAGTLLAALNDVLTRWVLKRKPSVLSALFIVRQFLNVGFLAMLYTLSPALGCDAASLLIGGALGITVPSIFFAARLAKQERAKQTAPQDGQTAQGEERERNG